MTDQDSAFARATELVCPCCLELYENGQIQREAVMPLPQYGPRLRSTGKPCCFDCQAAETLIAITRTTMPFEMSRLPIANERLESLRLPKGAARAMGLCQQGIMRPASADDFDSHMRWIDTNVPAREGDAA